ncbi:MAG TPA: rhamnogalacturonan lyase [Tepidisphaeraceae bacterium]|nr:rhamnogalacturonan lyase [Tepidisphaeraceae bacterium]
MQITIRAVALMIALSSPALAAAQRQMEQIDRGVVAIHQGDRKVFVGWRLLGTDPADMAFNVYRASGGDAAKKLNDQPLTGPTHFVDAKADLAQPTVYTVRPIVNGKEQDARGSFILPANAPAQPYLSIPLKTPEGYSPNDASAADLDGDGQYDLVLHQTGRARDNSQKGQTDPPILQGYKLDGTLLWTINLGRNIREGAHYTQFMVYDLDGDGRAEVVCKTSDGTTDGTGKVIGDANANHVNPDGHVLKGPEWLTVFDGKTGAAIDTVKYVPARTNNNPEDPDLKEYATLWRDNYGNRGERYLAAVAYLDGKQPSVVMCRGYYERTTLAAWDFKDGKLKHRWLFDTGPDRENPYFGQGNHSLAVADVDEDGRDEIVYGGAVIDDNGKGLFSTGLGHGDAMHVSDLDPENPGLEMFRIQERFDDAGAHMVALKTGKILWRKPSRKAADSGGDKGEGPGRGVSFDIDPRHLGNESWTAGAGIEGLWNVKGEEIGRVKPASCNFAVWWDGDLLRELLDRNHISKWNWKTEKTERILTAEDCTSVNGTKATPSLSADLLGDWREEVIWPTTDGKELRLYTTTIPTEHRLVTLMHDPIYRLSIAWQNVAYNQPPHPGFYLGEGMKNPPKPSTISGRAAPPARQPR